MGWWAPDIMGGDTPLDFESVFEERFGAKEPGDWQTDLPEFRLPTADEGLEFLNHCRGLGWGWDSGIVAAEVTAYLIMDRGAPMHDDVREAAIQACSDEDTSTWNDPSERDAVLADFVERVKVYPADGGNIELPHQRGLFEMIAAKTGPGLINDNTK